MPAAWPGRHATEFKRLRLLHVFARVAYLSAALESVQQNATDASKLASAGSTHASRLHRPACCRTFPHPGVQSDSLHSWWSLDTRTL